MTELFMAWTSQSARDRRLQWLIAEVATAKLPRRRQSRPNEPRAQYYEPQVFSTIKGSREEARQALKKPLSKS